LQSSAVVPSHVPLVVQFPAVKHLLDGVHAAPGVGVVVHPVGSTHDDVLHCGAGPQTTGSPVHSPEVPVQ
jgi:hypothetical protein